MKRIGLLSDTHSFVDPAIFNHFSECDEIWHAGDFGQNDFLHRLENGMTNRNIKAVLRGVFGNIDDAEARSEFPLDTKFEIEKISVWMTHIGGYPNRYHQRIREDLKRNPPKIFIAGHSHILKVQYDKKLNLLHLNPGAAGNYGFHKIRTMLRFSLDNGEIKNMEIIELSKRG